MPVSLAREANRNSHTALHLFRRGFNPDESPERAIAHKEQTRIRRGHRVRRRAGENPSQTPPTSDLLGSRSSTCAQQHSAATAIHNKYQERGYFICCLCGVACPPYLYDAASNACIYCKDGFWENDDCDH